MKEIEFKFKSISILSIALLVLFTSCSNEDDDDDELGNWITKSVYDGSPRSGVSSFVIGNIGYMGVGYDGDDYLNSFWAYDMDGNYWSQKADFIGSARNAAVGFSINDKGYIGSGYDGLDELADFYAYDPQIFPLRQEEALSHLDLMDLAILELDLTGIMIVKIFGSMTLILILGLSLLVLEGIKEEPLHHL